jgi:hypothetical protein
MITHGDDQDMSTLNVEAGDAGRRHDENVNIWRLFELSNNVVTGLRRHFAVDDMAEDTVDA